MARHRARAALRPVYVPVPTRSSRPAAYAFGALGPSGRVRSCGVRRFGDRPAHCRIKDARGVKHRKGEHLWRLGHGLPEGRTQSCSPAAGGFPDSRYRGNGRFMPSVFRKAGESGVPGRRRAFPLFGGGPAVAGHGTRGGRRTVCGRTLTVRNRPTAGHGRPRGSMMARPRNRRRHTDFSAERRLKAEWKRISLVWNTFDAIGPARGRLAGPAQCDVRWTHATRGVL